MATIGKNIRRLRKEKGLTQKQLGELCGIDEANIRRYELEKANPKKETLEKIAKALNVSVLSLFGFDELTKQRNADIQKVAQRRHIDKVIKNLENIGCYITFSSLQEDDFPDEEICAIYFNGDNKFIVVNDEELLEIEKNVNDFLKFKLNELINSKEIKESKSVVSGSLQKNLNQ